MIEEINLTVQNGIANLGNAGEYSDAQFVAEGKGKRRGRRQGPCLSIRSA